MKLPKLREVYPDRHLLKMIRRSVLASFVLGMALGMSVAFIKLAELKGQVIELYQSVLVPAIIVSLFIFLYLYTVFVVFPEIERRLNERD